MVDKSGHLNNIRHTENINKRFISYRELIDKNPCFIQQITIKP